MPDTPEAAGANRLYWESDVSVADIAARYDLSRRALYDAVRPLPTGVTCGTCGAETEFMNRLARRSGTASCPACGAVQDSPATPIDDREPVPGSPDAPARAHPVRIDARTDDLRQRAVLLGGAAIAGIALGGVATWLARRRG